MKLPCVVPVAYHPHAGFHYTQLLTLMILVALIICDMWIWVAVGIGEVFIDLGIRKFFNTKITCSGSMVAPVWLSVSLHYNNGMIAVMDC